MITLSLITAFSCELDAQQELIKNGLRLHGASPGLLCTCTHTHIPAVACARAAQNLKSSMNTEADRPIIRCTLRSASPPLRGSRCENPVAFAQASSHGPTTSGAAFTRSVDGLICKPFHELQFHLVDFFYYYFKRL